MSLALWAGYTRRLESKTTATDALRLKSDLNWNLFW
jgi:hypothetical protein